MLREGVRDRFPIHEDDSCNTVLHMVGLCFPRKPFPGAGNLEKGERKTRRDFQLSKTASADRKRGLERRGWAGSTFL